MIPRMEGYGRIIYKLYKLQAHGIRWHSIAFNGHARPQTEQGLSIWHELKSHISPTDLGLTRSRHQENVHGPVIHDFLHTAVGFCKCDFLRLSLHTLYFDATATVLLKELSRKFLARVTHVKTHGRRKDRTPPQMKRSCWILAFRSLV